MDAVIDSKAWDEALARLMTFLAAMEIGGLEHRTEMAMKIVTQARQTFDPASGKTPVEETMSTANAMLRDWFSKALELPASQGQSLISAGLFALRVTHVGERWPDCVLNGDPPEELKRELRSIHAMTGPDLSISSMTPREMDYGPLEDIAGETWHRFAWAPLVRAAIIWTVIFFAALAIHDHFFLK